MPPKCSHMFPTPPPLLCMSLILLLVSIYISISNILITLIPFLCFITHCPHTYMFMSSNLITSFPHPYSMRIHDHTLTATTLIAQLLDQCRAPHSKTDSSLPCSTTLPNNCKIWSSRQQLYPFLNNGKHALLHQGSYRISVTFSCWRNPKEFEGNGSTRRSSWGSWLPLLDVYIFKEMMPPFVMAVGLCSTLGMSLLAMVGLVREVAVSGLPLGVALLAAVLQMPKFISQSMPLACMFGSIFALGRLEANNECTVLYTFGIRIWRLLVAPMCISSVAALLTFGCNELLLPYASARSIQMVQMASTTQLQHSWHIKDLIRSEYVTQGDNSQQGSLLERTLIGQVDMNKDSDDFLQRIWYAKQVEGTQMFGILVLELLPSGRTKRIITADKGEWNSQYDLWHFHHSTVLEVSHEGSRRKIIQVNDLEVQHPNVQLPMASSSSTMQELSRQDIMQQVSSLRSKSRSAKISREQDGQLNQSIYNKDCKRIISEASHTSAMPAVKLVGSEAAARKLECLLFQRDAAALSCVVYGLIGASTTLALSQVEMRARSRAVPFVISIFGVLIYSFIKMLACLAAMAGLVSPVVSAWFPTVAGLLLGLSLPRILKRH